MHERSILKKSPSVDIRPRYQPYTPGKARAYRYFLR